MAQNRMIDSLLACVASVVLLAAGAVAQSTASDPMGDLDLGRSASCECDAWNRFEAGCDSCDGQSDDWQSDCGCRAAGCRGKTCMTARDMWEREPAAGDQSQHYSYDTQRSYYYRRPYNAAHVRQARMQGSFRGVQLSDGFTAQANPAAAALDRSDIFSRVNRQIAAQLSQPIEGGYLEYIDWRAHRQAKQAWQQEQVLTESELETYSEQATEQATERAAKRWPKQPPLR